MRRLGLIEDMTMLLVALAIEEAINMPFLHIVNATAERLK